MDNYKTFDDLEFNPHQVIPHTTQAIMEFDNGHRISVVGGDMFVHGNGVDTFEIWRSCDDNVIGYLSREQVTEKMIELQELVKGSEHHPFGF